MFEGILNLMFGWTLFFGNLGSILIMSFILTFLITIIYKYTTDQILLKDLKGQVKVYQKQTAQLRKDGDTEKMMEVNKKAMKLNLQYMKHSFKPMLYTFIPVILIFGWVRNNAIILGKDLVSWGFKIPLFGTGLGWFGVYFISPVSILISVVPYSLSNSLLSKVN